MLTIHFTRSDARQWCSESVNHSPSSAVISAYSVYMVSEILCTAMKQAIDQGYSMICHLCCSPRLFLHNTCRTSDGSAGGWPRTWAGLCKCWVRNY